MRIYISVSEEVGGLFEKERKKMSMTRGQYLSYLLGGRKQQIPSAIRYYGMVTRLSEIQKDLHVLCMKEDLTPEEKLYVFARFQDLVELIEERVDVN